MSLPSSPGKMDLTALGGLKKRVLVPAPESVDFTPVIPVEPEQAVPAPEVLENVHLDVPQHESGVSDVLDTPQDAGSVAEPAEPVTPEAQSADGSMEQSTQSEVVGTGQAFAVTVDPTEEHSGNVTLYLSKDLNDWLEEHHDRTGIAYPGIVLNAISWAAADNRLAQIFAPIDSLIPANDIFGRAPSLPRQARGSIEPATRPVRFRKDHMRVIISLARIWTDDNRNAFFTGVLAAYREHLQQVTE